ncbi:hypothetical protein F4859DRAFT_278948 [Xylaria cf. heliscus]|nr:hypothetical protein F4859DRAFT_278948 [Xylaria cf. heliscus]
MLSDQDTVAKFTPLSKGFRRSISEPSFDTDTHYCNDVDALIFDIFDDGDKPLVSLIVQGLHQLPVEQRAIVYDLDQDVHQYTDGYSEGTSVQAVATPSDETSTIGDTRSSTSFSIPSSGKPPPGTKRKRQRGEFPFACPFHKFWASKFTIKYGPDGHNRFKSCSGPGWTDIKNLGDHIRNVHLRPQCPRCWKTWGREEERSKHLSQDPRVDCPDNSHNIYQIESVSYDVFSSIKRILSTPRPRKKTSTSKDLVTQLTSRDKWYAVKDEIFPPAKYPEFNPEHPFYQNPDGNLIKSSAAEREEVLQLTKTMVKAKADEAVRTNQVGDADAFRLSSDEVVELVMRVFDLSIGRAESTHSPLPNASGEPSALLQEQPQLHPKPPNLAQGGGQPMPNAINVDDQDVEIRVQLLQFA